MELNLRGKREIGCYKLMCVCVVYLENIRVHNGEEINDCFEEWRGGLVGKCKVGNGFS